MMKRLSVALIQLSVTADKAANIKRASQMIHKAVQGSKNKPLVVLPECFNSLYGTKYFAEYAEPIPGPTTDMLSLAARETGCYIIGGSIPERRDDKLYNTCTVFNPSGEIILRYSKTHLFDIDIPGKIKFVESESLTAGDSLGMFDLHGMKVGVGICYDIRFADLGLMLARKGCRLLVYPGAFNMTTGPAHWQLLQQARALDNQVYVTCVSPARDTEASYVAWGHSMMVSPWGDVMASAQDKEDIIHTELDIERLEEIRTQIPIHKQRRNDLYHLS